MLNYISLLRGINVSGQKKMKMADLRTLCDDLGLANVQSYVQSGNLVFQSDETPDSLSSKIHDAIEAHWGYSVEIFIFSQNDWQKIIEANPFDDGEKDKKSLHVTLLSESPDEQLIQAVDTLDFGADDYRILDNVVYLYCPNGYGRTKLTNTFWEKKLKVSATTRNWNSVNKLRDLVEAL